ncbi:serine/threonine-protein kinase [Actinocorallia longicatena]|uniref:non-specific serine/threonine protein kinase n=1 Tax=Actinocorallia longicatena TaxID=111803 RepID=A0ABP6QH81_9ACTN
MPEGPDVTAHRLVERYQLLSVLGSGGMGTVWRARDETLGREVAIKELTLSPELDAGGRAEACARAVREAQAAAQLRHPGIVVVHDAFIDDDRPWIVMQLLQGQTLDVVLKSQGPISVPFAAEIGLQVVKALIAAHTVGILHRDIKPGNIFLTADGRAVLTDFGIATVEGQATITRSGMLVGSPGHIAPERLRGESGGPQSDLWSLAATLYRAVEGISAYPGDDHIVVLTKVLTQDPRPPSAAGELAPLLLHMLAKDPRVRPDPVIVEGVLARVAQGGASGVIPLPPAPPAAAAPEGRTTVDVNWRPPRKPSRLLAPALAGGVLLLALAAVAVVVTDGEPETKPPAVAKSSAPVTSAPATASAAPAGKFTGPIDFCTVMTSAQARQIIKNFKGEGKASGSQEPSCAWDAPGAGVEIGLQGGSLDDDPYAMTPEDAHDRFHSRFQSALKGSDKVIWHYGDIGGESITSGIETKAEQLTGIGDEAYVTDTLGRLDAQKTEVVFRVSNVVIEVTHADVSRKTGGKQIRANAIQFARWAAENLKARS